MQNPKTLVVDDDEPLAEMISKLLSSKGYDAAWTCSPNRALEILAEDANYRVMLVDLVMPEIDGIELLKRVRELNREIDVIVMTSYATIDNAVAAMKEGATDFITKPLKQEVLLLAIEKALKKQSLEHEVARLRAELDIRYNFGNLIGENAKMRHVYELIGAVAETDATVLIAGETGTGKELVARAIHYNSSRKTRPFLKVDCAALTETLLESELFGHERGAFTGAVKSRAGRFERAHSGTLFLDEVGNIPLNIQAKLLRVIQDQEFERVGGEEVLKVDVRIIAATNSNLTEAVKAGTFRRDLYYRLNVVTIEVPPLRERREDIPLLANHFLKTYAKKNDKPILGLSAQAVEKLMEWHWPGNVRELENAIERAVVLCRGNTIEPGDILLPSIATSTEPTKWNSLQEAVDATERQVLEQTLRECNGDPTEAAHRLKISRATLYNKLKKYRIGSSRVFRAV